MRGQETEASPPSGHAHAGPRRLAQHDIVDLAFDAMFSRDFASRAITSWNDGAERLYGFTRDEAMGKRPQDLLASIYPMPLEGIEADLVEHGWWEGELVQTRKDGSRVVVLGRWGLQTDTAGAPLTILEINSDLTAESQSAERLERSEERFGLLVSAVIDYAIFILDPQGIVMSWNEGAQRIKGYRAEEIIGRHFSAFYPPEDAAAGKPQRGLEIAARDGHYQDEGWRVRKDGSRFWASVVITPLRAQNGELRGFGKVTRDITDRKTHEEQLREHARRMAELEQAKTHFLDLAAHELRGPLTLIRGYNSMLETGGLPVERIPEIAHMLEGRLAQIDLLVEQMLEMARLESDRLELRYEAFDVRDVVREQLDRFAPLTAGQELSLVDGQAAIVEADRSRISTVVGNLVDNAIKYSPKGGDIVCTVRTSQDSVYVSVRDHGFGIAPEHMTLLFKRFSRLPTEENEAIRGTGLALYVCQQIARKHGGRITVDSRRGGGSEFTLELPVKAPLAAA